MTTRFVGINDRGLRVGQDHHNASMTDREVELIRRLRAEGMPVRIVAEKMECSKTQVSQVCNGKRRNQRAVEWKRVAARPESADREGAQSPATIEDSGATAANPPPGPP